MPRRGENHTHLCVLSCFSLHPCRGFYIKEDIMAKDPAFLFYYQDFLVGVDHMTDEQIGQYIKCLCHQANRGSIREQHMKNICKTSDNLVIIKEKFVPNENGDLINIRLSVEQEKRRKFSESRRNNRLQTNICKTLDKHMENENEDVNKDIKRSKPIKKKYDFEVVWAKYPKKLGKKEALGYFNMSVRTDDDFIKINQAIDNYNKHIKTNYTENKFIKEGNNWFKDWEDWVGYKEEVRQPREDSFLLQQAQQDLSKMAKKETIIKWLEKLPKDKHSKLKGFLCKTYKDGEATYNEAEDDYARKCR